MYSLEEAYAFLASDSDATDTASDFDPGQFSDTSSDTSSICEPAAISSCASPARPNVEEDWVPPQLVQPNIPPFSANAGINVNVDDFSPMQYMELFLGDTIWEEIASQTNLYATQFSDANPGSYVVREHAWYPTDVPELKKFWALTMLMGIIKKPSIRSYWSTNPICSSPVYSQTMSRKRYELVLKNLHFNDNTLCHPRDHPQYDRLHKIRPLVDHLQHRFSEVYTPQQNVSIDESLMKYKGRLGFKQYIPSKRSRYGVKLYKLCESESGYTFAFRVYEGKDGQLDPPGCPDSLGTSGKIVWDLLIPLFNKGYHLYVDNFYSSVCLFKTLYGLQTLACGTVRKNSKDFPRPLIEAKLKKGECKALRKAEVLAIKFKDKKDVNMLTTIHDESMSDVTVRGKVHSKPVCIRAYNRHMGGVDLADQLLQPYLILRKTRAWYKKVAIYLMQVATHNSFLLFKKMNPGKTTFLQFQLKVISTIIYGDGSVEVPTRRIQSRIGATHFIFKIPPTAHKTNPQKRCRVCYKKGKRTDTPFHCPDCPSKPGLCIGTCFKLYHTEHTFL